MRQPSLHRSPPLRSPADRSVRRALRSTFFVVTCLTRLVASTGRHALPSGGAGTEALGPMGATGRGYTNPSALADDIRTPKDGLERVPALRPKLPSAERLLPYLRRIDANRVYANWGPLVEELEFRIAD